MNRLVIMCMATLLVMGCSQQVVETDEATAPQAEAQSEVEGVWEVIEASGTNDEGDWKTESIQPSLYIFHDGYYSAAVVQGDEARPLMPEDATRESLTEEQVRAILVPYSSNAGTYSVNGSTLTTIPVIALWPNNMQGNPVARTYSIGGGILSLSWENQMGSFNYRLQRLR